MLAGRNVACQLDSDLVKIFTPLGNCADIRGLTALFVSQNPFLYLLRTVSRHHYQELDNGRWQQSPALDGLWMLHGSRLTLFQN